MVLLCQRLGQCGQNLLRLLKPQHRMMMANYATETLFTDTKQAECYAKFRPQYTDQVFQRIIGFCREGSTELDLAVDVGCGSGQSTVPLAKHFKQVIGADVSEQQIANTTSTLQNVNFRISVAEDLNFVKSSSADLVTMAQAFHWVQKDKFFVEVNRVLKPGGSLIIYGYGTCELIPKEADDVFQHFYTNVLGNFWEKGRRMVEEKYATVSLPFPGWIRDDSLVIEKNCSVDDFIGYLGSFSAVVEYNKVHPDNSVLKQIEESLQKACQGQRESRELQLRVTWPVFMLMGHKPK